MKRYKLQLVDRLTDTGVSLMEWGQLTEQQRQVHLESVNPQKCNNLTSFPVNHDANYDNFVDISEAPTEEQGAIGPQLVQDILNQLIVSEDIHRTTISSLAISNAW